MPTGNESERKIYGMALAVKRGKADLASLPKELQAKISRLLSLPESELRALASRPRPRAGVTVT